MENRERGKGDPQQRGADPIKQAELMLAEGVGMSELRFVGGTLQWHTPAFTNGGTASYTHR